MSPTWMHECNVCDILKAWASQFNLHFTIASDYLGLSEPHSRLGTLNDPVCKLKIVTVIRLKLWICTHHPCPLPPPSLSVSCVHGKYLNVGSWWKRFITLSKYSAALDLLIETLSGCVNPHGQSPVASLSNAKMTTSSGLIESFQAMFAGGWNLMCI